MIELSNNPNMKHCGDTLIYALENLNTADRLDDFSKKSIYIDMLKESISGTQESLEFIKSKLR